jgi:hypothetical protein
MEASAVRVLSDAERLLLIELLHTVARAQRSVVLTTVGQAALPE